MFCYENEVYVRSMMAYHGGSLFGKAVDHPDKLAKAVLSIMVKCLYGGPEFIHKALPVSNLTGDFLLKEATPILNTINEPSMKVVLKLLPLFQTHIEQIRTASNSSTQFQVKLYLLFSFFHSFYCVLQLVFYRVLKH